MNDVPRGTSRTKLINSLLTPGHDEARGGGSAVPQAHVIFSLDISDSRLDDELSVATIEFSDPPPWLQFLTRDPFGFPKKTAFGTLWKGIEIRAADKHGRTEFIRAAIDGNLQYAETLAEFKDTDVNAQDDQARTALHWACVNNHSEIVRLCLSVPELDVGLKDQDNLTAFDISRRGKSEVIPMLFYMSMFEMEEDHPQAALLRVLTVTAEVTQDRVVFPGIAIFDPVQDDNKPLVKALIDRGINLAERGSGCQPGGYR